MITVHTQKASLQVAGMKSFHSSRLKIRFLFQRIFIATFVVTRYQKKKIHYSWNVLQRISYLIFWAPPKKRPTDWPQRLRKWVVCLIPALHLDPQNHNRCSLDFQSMPSLAAQIKQMLRETRWRLFFFDTRRRFFFILWHCTWLKLIHCPISLRTYNKRRKRILKPIELLPTNLF